MRGRVRSPALRIHNAPPGRPIISDTCAKACGPTRPEREAEPRGVTEAQLGLNRSHRSVPWVRCSTDAFCVPLLGLRGAHIFLRKPLAGALTDGLDNKMLASFVPALVMKELEKGDALQLPSSQQYEAVALFAVRCLPSPSTLGFVALLWALIPWRLPQWPGRISRASRT